MGLLTEDEIAAMTDTLGELTNALLIEVADPGAPDESNDPGAPAVVWRGQARAFFSRERRTSTLNDVERVDVVDTLRIYDAEGAPTTYTAGAAPAGSTVVVTYGATTLRWTVEGMERDSDGTLDSTLLELATPTTP